MPEKCGFRLNHNISICISFNLNSGSWTYADNAIDVANRPPGIVFRPHLVYNRNTKLYVLIWNYMNFAVAGQIAVAVSETSVGPFTVVNRALNITRGSSGDFNILVDSDGSEYIIYSSNSMDVEKLASDFYHIDNSPCYVFPETFVEAPVLLKRYQYYYALYDRCCCYCGQGSGILVYHATLPLGPNTQQPGGDIACEAINQTNIDGLLDDRIQAFPTPNNVVNIIIKTIHLLLDHSKTMSSE